MAGHSRPETVDEQGVRHRYGCEKPGFMVAGSAVSGLATGRCQGCGAVKILRRHEASGRPTTG